MSKVQSRKQHGNTSPPNRFIHKSAKIFYFTCRALRLFQFKYDSEREQLELQPYKTLLRNCLFFLLFIVGLLLQNNVESSALSEAIFTLKNNLARDYTFLAQEAAFIGLLAWTHLYGLARLCVFLLLEKYRRPLQRLVNETLQVRRQTLNLTGRDVRVRRHFKCTLWLKLVLFLLGLFHQQTTDSVHCYYFVYELFYCAYQTMQLTLLSLHRNLNSYSMKRLNSQRNCRQRNKSLRSIAQLLQRIHVLHELFERQFVWFPLLVYFEIFGTIRWTYLLITCAVRSVKQSQQPFGVIIYVLLFVFAPLILLPIMNVFGIATLNDELYEETQLSGDLQTIASIQQQSACPCRYCNGSKRTCSLHVLRLKLQPLAVKIFGNTKLNREFSFEFFLAIMLYSLGFAMYKLEHEGFSIQCL